MRHSTWQAAKSLLSENCSPGQADARRSVWVRIGHETIYRRIYADKAEGGSLYQYLRCGKKQRKRYGSGRTRRGQIPDRLGIEHRCPRVEGRAIVAYWEAGLKIGKNREWVIVTPVAYRTGLALVRRVPTNRADAVAAAIIQALVPYKARVRTTKFEDGLRFSRHESIAAKLDAKVYFVNPHCSWEQGSNENYNGLPRQSFAKGSCLASMTNKQLNYADLNTTIEHKNVLHSRYHSSYPPNQQIDTMLHSNIEIATYKTYVPKNLLTIPNVAKAGVDTI